MSEKPTRPIPVEETVTVDCACGKTHCFKIRHYDRLLLKCGRMMWALQPKRNGPLVMFPWPGPPMSERELAVKESGEREDNWAAGRWTA